MESLVVQPGATHVRPVSEVCEGAGILPGRLPFILRSGAIRGVRLLHRYVRAKPPGGFLNLPKTGEDKVTMCPAAPTETPGAEIRTLRSAPRFRGWCAPIEWPS